ncbi:extracellular solute-binding protein [uncultured Rhodospira sp.]|uniref:extracellular solute-binding protein n=1 Tax=uncultured Rhodospira sp. TaxID=1936189 RepID=UPI002618C61D|nr:extracellular solute-binding protein [uncultured Rhodospira sp.]
MTLKSAAALVGALLIGASAAHAETLVIAGRDGGYADALALAVESYKAANPGLEVERLALGGGPLREKVTIAMREKAGAYDVVMLDDIWAVEFMSNGWLSELDALDEDFVAPARAVARYPVGEGPFYAKPFVGNVELFAYNTALFDKHGLNRPESWTDVVNAAKTIDEAEDGVSGVVFRGKKANPIVTGFLPILWAHGGRVVTDDGAAGLDSEAALDALNLYLDLAQYAPKGVETYNSGEVRDALMQGTTAMAIELWPSWAPDLDDPEKSKVVGQIEIMAAPGQVQGPAPMLGTWLVAVPADAPNPERGKDFIAFLTSPEVQKVLALEVGTPPTRASVYRDAEVVDAYRWYPAQVAALNNAQPRARITQWAEVETILGDFLQLALIGEMEPKAALEGANQRIARALAR